MPTRSRSRRRSLVAFALGALLASVVAAGLTYWFLGRGRPAPLPDPSEVHLRAEFTRLVLDKAEADVVAAVGPPDSTSEDDQAKYWHYKRRTRDPLTDVTDSDVQVVVQDGKVVAVNY